MKEYCVCGHNINEHAGWEGEPTGCTYELSSRWTHYDSCQCSEFKLDNLRFVEDLAKKRNLIN